MSFNYRPINSKLSNKRNQRMRQAIIFTLVAVALSSCVKDRVSPPTTGSTTAPTSGAVIYYWNFTDASKTTLTPAYIRPVASTSTIISIPNNNASPDTWDYVSPGT